MSHLPRVLPNLGFHSSDNLQVVHRVRNSTSWGGKLCNKDVALFEKLTTKVFIVAGVDAHLGRVDSRTVASTIFPVTTSGHVHST